MPETRIMHVITGTALGGAEVMLLRYLRAQGETRAGHVAVSMMPCGAMAAEIEKLGVPVLTMGVRGAVDIPAGVLRLPGTIRAHDPRVPLPPAKPAKSSRPRRARTVPATSMSSHVTARHAADREAPARRAPIAELRAAA